MPLLVTRKERFSAGHRLHNPRFNDEQNEAVFGKCSNPSGHGHNYELEVVLRGEIEESTGYVFDLGSLADIIQKEILADVDHKNLNTDVEWLIGKNPTTEVLADAFWERLEPHLPPGMLECVRVWETPKNSAERRRS